MPGFQFDQAIEFFRNKIKLPTSGWTDIWQEQHSHAFVVAGAAHDALVEDFYNTIQKAKWETGGGGYEGFRTSFDEIVAKHGWAHNGAPGWRSKIIYDTNITQAYNAGRYQQMVALKDIKPFWVYQHTSIEHPRLQHVAWNGIILPADHEWFRTHMPQNGWGCKCRVYALSHFEAERMWKAKGNNGPDTPPIIEMEERIVGKNGSNPRTVWVPKGIDPGFAYNPGMAWLEPYSPPPTGYDSALKDRIKPFHPEKSTKYISPVYPAKLPSSVIVNDGTTPEFKVSEFLDIFDATMERGSVFTDKAGSSLAITKSLFQDGSGSLKWMDEPEKADRMKYINLLALTLIDPDEIWWVWLKDNVEKGRWRLKRLYLKAFEIEGSAEYGVSIFEWGKDGWSGATTFMASHKKEPGRAAYFEKQRNGRLVYKKKTQPD